MSDTLLATPVAEKERPIEGATIEKYQNFLQLIYDGCSNGESIRKSQIREFAIKHGVASAAPYAVLSARLISVSAETGLCKWRDGEPSPSKDTALRLIKQARIDQKDYRERKAKGELKSNPEGAGRKPGSKNKPTEILSTARKIKPEVTAKYKLLLDDVYAMLKGVKHPVLATKLNMRDKLNKYKLDSFTIKALTTLNIVERSGTSAHTFAYKWVTRKPTSDMAFSLHTEARRLQNSQQNEGRAEKLKTARRPYKKSSEEKEKAIVAPSVKKQGNADAWKQVAHKAIDMDDPHLALLALNKMK
jgi:hypothetical protein